MKKALSILASLALAINSALAVGTVGPQGQGIQVADQSSFIAKLGGTTAGKALFQLPNPNAIRFIRINADNSATLLDAAGFLTAIGGGSGDGDVTLTGAQTLTNKDLTDATNTLPAEIGFALSDETTAITTGVAKITIRMPYAMTVTGVRASLNQGSITGVVTVDINEAGTSILSTKLTIDESEDTSVTAAIPAVISDTALADNAKITFDIDVAGEDAAGLKVWIIGTR